MTTVYEAKLGRVALDMRLPEYIGSLTDGPTDDFVVCYRRDGTPASCFGDLVWDFTAYQPEQRVLRFYFAYWGAAAATVSQLARSREVRRVLFSLIWHRPGAPLSLGTLSNYVTVLCAVAVRAEELNLSVGQVFSDANVLLDFASSRCSGWMCETLGSLLGVLAKIEDGALGFKVASAKTIAQVKARAKAYRASIKQHAPMPTRIYSIFISQLKQVLADWQPIAKDALALFQACGSDPFMGRTTEQQLVVAKKLEVELLSPRPTFDALCSPALKCYMTAAGKALNVKSLSFLVTELQLACKLFIQTFTGMRDDEACSLPYHCLVTTVADGKTHYVVKGRTTKFNHGLPKQVRWVTNQEGEQAIKAAQAIADAIYAAHGIVPDAVVGTRLKHPLFPSPGYMNLASKHMAPDDGAFVPGGLVYPPGSALLTKLFACIEESDLQELEHIDPHRAWRSEDSFQVGEPWAFKTHQLRRSLALYAQRSGLVSLPSLRRQLQHLTEEMSRYYAKGSAFAKDFIGDEKEHFGLEWQATQPESSALSYILNVLMADDVLIGGHANWVQHRLKDANGLVLVDRAATLRRFKKGEMAYKETLIGGCTNTDECDQVALRWLDVDCLRDGCRNMVCNLTKLGRVVAAQEKLVAAIDPQSIEYRTELADLEVLRSARDKAKQEPVGEPQ